MSSLPYIQNREKVDVASLGPYWWQNQTQGTLRAMLP